MSAAIVLWLAVVFKVSKLSVVTLSYLPQDAPTLYRYH
jgi:hypothetical protein